MSKFITAQWENNWTSMCHLKELPRESLISLKWTWLHSLQTLIWTKQNTSGTIGQVRPKGREVHSQYTAAGLVNWFILIYQHRAPGCQAWWRRDDDLHYFWRHRALLSLSWPSSQEWNVRTPIWPLKLELNLVMQQNNDPNVSQYTFNKIEKKYFQRLNRFQSSTLTEILQWDLYK